MEIKSKNKRNFYDDVSISYDHYLEYQQKSKQLNLPILLIFVDESLGQVYGNYLHILEQPCKFKHNNDLLDYPLLYNDGIYFHIHKMKFLFKLNKTQITELKQFTKK